ncbi:MAG: DNA-3-methyladenine glycosylase [Anaerolineales bacterium]|nr:DNA-3-methyladenine glycosylase [Anaerolineales bacterium]
MNDSLPRSFFSRPTLQVARDLLGARLVHVENGVRLSGLIVEAEAYVGETDLGCHSKAGRTPRTAVMYGPPGHAYVYFTYGMHWLFNVITEDEGFPAAVLIRAVDPTEGIEIMAARRAGRPRKDWTNGPAKLTQAMGISAPFNGLDLCAPDSPLFFEPGDPIPDARVTTTPRVGLYTVPEPWKSIPWRFLISPS